MALTIRASARSIHRHKLWIASKASIYRKSTNVRQSDRRARFMKINVERYGIELAQKAEELRQIVHRRGYIVAERAPEDLEETLLLAEREAAAHELERTYRLLRQVEAALTRIRSGEYGSCLKCELAIPEKRLR